MFDLRDFCVKQMRDMETNIAYLTTTLTPSKAFFKDVKKKVKEKGIKFKDRWVRYFTTENGSHFVYGSYRGHSILRSRTNNIVILNDFNCCPEQIQVEMAKCYIPMWASVLCTTVIVTVDESKPTGTLIDDLIKQNGCSHT
jgi:hypothetical protein